MADKPTAPALDKAAIAAIRDQVKPWLAQWNAELAAFKDERNTKVADAHKATDEKLKAAALVVGNAHKDASIGRHGAIVGALEEILARCDQVETHLAHRAD